MRKIIWLSFLLFMGSGSVLYGQPYDLGIGIRAGYSNGLSLKYFTDHDRCAELLTAYNRHGFQATLQYQYEFSPYAKERLYYYAGGGIHLGNWENEPAAGVAVSVGAEFVFREVPLAMGVEWKPMLNAIRVFDHALADFGLTVRFLIQ